MPTSVGVISQIQLPNGNIYDIVDRISEHGLNYVIAYKSGVPVVANIPAGVTVIYNDTAYIGTKAADNTTYNSIYLVKSVSQVGESDYYDEYITLREGAEGSYTYSWEKLGDTRITIKDITATTGTASAVTIGSESKTVSGGSTDKVLGVDTTFSGSSTFTDTSTKKYLHKNSYIKSITPTSDSAIKTLDVDTENLVTTTITGTNGTESVSKVTKTTKKLVTTSITPVSGTTSVTGVSGSTSVYGVKGDETTTASSVQTTSQNTVIPFVEATTSNYDGAKDILKGTSVSNETLIFGAYIYNSGATSGSGATLRATSVQTTESASTVNSVTVPIRATSATTVPTAASSATTVPIAGTAVTVATGKLASSDTNGDTVVDSVTISDKTVAKAASSATTVATGATSANGTGSPVVTGVTSDTTITALTGLGTPTTGSAYDTLNTTSSGGDAVVTAVSGTVSTSVTKGTNDQVDALTSAGSVTVPTISKTDVTVVTDVQYDINDDIIETTDEQ